jgi:hypothetical protein
VKIGANVLDVNRHPRRTTVSYVHISSSPGMNLQNYDELLRQLGPEPIAGQTSHLVGQVDGALVIVDVYESRVAADKFAAERLFPAFERAGLRPNPDTTIVAFEPIANADV